MNGKDIIRLELINFGFCREININTNSHNKMVCYNVYAKNDDEVEYNNDAYEKMDYHVDKIREFMSEKGIKCRTLFGTYRINQLLRDDTLNELLSLSVNRRYCKSIPYPQSKDDDK